MQSETPEIEQDDLRPTKGQKREKGRKNLVARMPFALGRLV
jgi:hypothetical protein